jgi:5'-3' exonuclease
MVKKVLKSDKPISKTFSPPIINYPNSTNRLLLIDWASLSYHKIFSMNTEKNRAKLGLNDANGELIVWRSHMISSIMSYIRLFNPKNIIFALEGHNVWRKQYVKDYYKENTKVYYDDKSYYVQSDNKAFKVTKIDTDFNIVSLSPENFSLFDQLPYKKLGELKQSKQDMLWDVYDTSGNPILASYKGTRGKNFWPFKMDKKEWRTYKDVFCGEISPIFRSKAIGVDEAEGDDVLYNGAKYLSKNYESVIVITGDSDMSQIDIPNVKIFNHRTNNFVECISPTNYLNAKILAGDSSDNIKGMALFDTKKNRLKTNLVGETGAIKMLEECQNIYEKAKLEHWDNQYIRNRNLIDLSCTPKTISTKIIDILNEPYPNIIEPTMLSKYGIRDIVIDDINKLKESGYYTFYDDTYLNEHPNIFTVNDKSTAVDSEEYVYDRIFENIDNLFDRPNFDPLNI